MTSKLTEILNSQDKNKVLPEVYDELIILAKSALRKNIRHNTLNTSAVVHESIIKFYKIKSHSFESRGHFFALMSKMMRELIIDYARSKNAKIHGGNLKKVTLNALNVSDDKQDFEINHLLDMDYAMQKLAEFDDVLAQLLMMKFYGGLTIPELADCFETSQSSIKRELRTARAFVKAHLSDN